MFVYFEFVITILVLRIKTSELLGFYIYIKSSMLFWTIEFEIALNASIDRFLFVCLKRSLKIMISFCQ